MMPRLVRLGSLLALLLLVLAGCTTTRRLPAYEPPLKRSQFMKVRTTAYTHTENDHAPYTNHNAVGDVLAGGPDRSAAADWARWPAGTRFLVLATGQVYEVDDYGWALSGRNTIDLYCPSRDEMTGWGVRHVTIEILRWGNPWRCYDILKPREHHAYVRRMLWEIRKFY